MVGLDDQMLTSLVIELWHTQLLGIRREDQEKGLVLARVAHPRMRTSQMTVETLVVEEVVDCCPWLLLMLVVGCCATQANL